MAKAEVASFRDMDGWDRDNEHSLSDIPVSSPKFNSALLAVGAALLGLAASAWWFSPPPPPVLKTGTALPTPRAIGAFELVDANAQPFGPAQLTGRWTLVFAGFLTCPDICPGTLKFLQQLHGKLAAQGQDLGVLFLSIDPERDRPEQMKSYLEFFSPDFMGATAQEPQLMPFTRALGLAYQKVPTADGYTMDHSAALVLLNPQGNIAAYFSPPHGLDAMAADLRALMQ